MISYHNNTKQCRLGLLRLPLIEQTDEQGEIEVSLTDCPGRKISATDLANFIIKILKEGTFIKQAPFIANV